MKNSFTLLITFKRQLNFTITKIEYFFWNVKEISWEKRSTARCFDISTHSYARERIKINHSASRKSTVLCILDSYFCKEKHQTNSSYKNSDMLQGRLINAEFSLQSASHNSRKINQRQSWSQIREFWESFITYCCLRCYAQVVSFHPYFYPFLAIEALR